MAEEESVRVSGPLFDGRALVAADLMATALARVVSDRAVNEIKSNLQGSIQVWTGFYADHITSDVAVDGFEVTDGGQIVYGPWLEGVGSRNSSTEFKGYSSFQRTADSLNSGEAEAVAAAIAKPFIEEMN